MSLAEEILTHYLDGQRKLIEFEEVDKNSLVVSLPFHFAAHTRVEVAITRVSARQYVLSDMGQTIGELRDAGYSVGARLLERISELIKIWRVEFAGTTLVRTCSQKALGIALHEFGEAAKTIGDAYLIARSRDADRKVEAALKERVRQTFNESRYFYREDQTVPGSIEKSGHKVDFYISPNGSNGLALEVLTLPNKLQAEAWGFRTRDMKDANEKLIVGFVYDDLAKDLSRTILESTADITVSSAEFPELTRFLETHNVSRG